MLRGARTAAAAAPSSADPNSSIPLLYSAKQAPHRRNVLGACFIAASRAALAAPEGPLAHSCSRDYP